MKIKSYLTHKTPLRFLPALVPMLLGHAAFGANTLTPLLNTTVCPGETASFSTVPSGPGYYRFEWRKNGVLMSGQTNSNLGLPNVNSSSAATYSVKLRGHANSVTKSAA